MATDPFGDIASIGQTATRFPGGVSAFQPAKPVPGVERVSYQEAQGGARPLPSIVMPQAAAAEPDYTPILVAAAAVAVVGAGYWLYKRNQRKSIWKSIRTPRRE